MARLAKARGRVERQVSEVARRRLEAESLAERFEAAEEQLSLARVAFDEASKREAALASVDTDAFLGTITSDEAEYEREEARAAAADAWLAVERAEGIVETMKERVREAGLLVADAMEQEAAEPARAAEARLAEARAVVAEREREADLAREEFMRARTEAQMVRCTYD